MLLGLLIVRFGVKFLCWEVESMIMVFFILELVNFIMDEMIFVSYYDVVEMVIFGMV